MQSAKQVVVSDANFIRLSKLSSLMRHSERCDGRCINIVQRNQMKLMLNHKKACMANDCVKCADINALKQFKRMYCLDALAKPAPAE